ncbi:hypothetical protein BRADI_2g02920v3 [Brachypodium distachyon]|uniref:Uncharacterized protein n=1 Tax=Brachypodium distachyon TaxID=15368 RepID=A0A2K2D6L4_BRADI|nr:hypothetical protein BRADI_2g02920v3 [Brachypodium distachyon]
MQEHSALLTRFHQKRREQHVWRRRGSSPAAPASLPDDYDLLREILLRLPPQPSSLPRASVVCKLWRAVTTDPKFLQCFRAHHRKPPLLGYFGAAFGDKVEIVFRPTLDHPDRIPPERFSLRGCSRRENYVLGCRHGRVLVDCPAQKEVVVCEPISGGQRRVAVPPEFKNGFHDGAVLCAAGDQGHVHGGCHSCPFKVVLLCMPEEDNRALACLYARYDCGYPSILVGDALYWLDMSNGMLEFDLDGQSISVITGPPMTDDFCHGSIQIIKAEDGVVGLASFSYPSIQIWQRKVNCNGVATWLVCKTVDLHNIIGLPPQLDERDSGMETILGYAEDTNDILIYVHSSVYTVQLKSMQPKKLHETHHVMDYHPFTSFYTPGTHA